MPTNSAFDAYFKDAASRLAQNKSISPKSNPWANYKPITKQEIQATKKEEPFGGNLGQGLLDFLSTGSYAVAGIGERIGESVNKLGRGDLSNVLTDITGIGAITGAVKGVQDKRTWSENLTDLGADEGTSTWAGLALDIALDPAWLIPGGAVGKGITGTARGIGEASRLTKEGVQLTPQIMKGVQAATEGAARPGLRNLPKVSGEYGILSDVLKPSGQKISVASPQGLQNFALGIKQANIENYAEWSAARAQKKAFKALRKQGGIQTVVEDIPLEDYKAGVPVGNVADQATDQVVKIIDDKAKTQKVPDELKDAGAAEDIATATVEKVKATPAKTPKAKTVKAAEVVETAAKAAPTGSVYSRAKQELAPYRTEYQKANGFDTTEINYAAIKASEQAPEMARTYDQLVSDPTNPAVISAYAKLVEETKKQYDYLTNKLGIKIEYIKEDPYNVLKFDANGKPVWQKDENGKFVLDENGKKIQESTPDSRLMMDDVLTNKRLQVRDSEIDFAKYPHPILTIEENNLFRAVHDFFGHAASGRGFAVDGEEAAWVSHSSMFTPEARRAMTTETRGQNSYYNFFDPKRKTFAPQKAALFPEEYTLLPAEFDLVTGQALTTNAFIGRTTSALSIYADQILDDLTLVQTPIRGEVRYTAEQLTRIKNEVENVVKTATYAPNTAEVKEISGILKKIVSLLNDPFPEKLVTLEKPADVKTLKLLQQTLDESIDVTPLLNNLVKAEGRTITPPPPFKPTKWETKKGKPTFKVETLTKYFPNDELLTDPKKLGIAMGTTSIEKAKIYARKGETPAQAYARYQDTIWEDFRARNVEELKTVEATEKAAWNAKYDQPDSEMFTETSGKLVGLGNLPAGLPASVLTGSFNGKAMTTLGKVLENIDSMLVQGTLNPTVKTFLSEAFAKSYYKITKDGITIADMSAKEAAAAASKLLSTGVVKNYADARIAVSGRAEDISKLGAKPKMKLYVKPRESLREMPRTSSGGTDFKPMLRRDPTTGAPVDKLGNVVTDERQAAQLDVMTKGLNDEGDIGDKSVSLLRRITDDGKPFTGRSVAGPKTGAGSRMAEQSGVGAMQLADLQAVREAIGAINTGIKAKEFIAMPEQAALLTSVMTSIGIKVADNIAPEEVFKQFQKEALPAFNDMVKKIESAAKSEAVIYQARAVFNRSIDENISLMRAVEASDPGEVQRSVVKFTEDAVGLVDEFCATRFSVIGGPKTSATEFLEQITQGSISKGATDDGVGAIREAIAIDRYPENMLQAIQKGQY